MVIGFILAFKIKYKQIKKVPADTPKPKAKICPYERAAIWSAVVIFFIMTAYGAMITFIAIYAISKNISNIGVYFAVYTMGYWFQDPFFGKLIDSHGFGIGLFSGILSTIAALIILAFANSGILFLLSGLFFGVGFGSILAGFLAANLTYSQMYLLITAFPVIALIMFFVSSCWRRRL